MYQPYETQPTYRRFVFGTANAAAVSIFLFVYAWVAMIVIIWGGFVPTIDELHAAGVHYLAVAGYGVTLFGMIFHQNDKWVSVFRRRSAPQPETAPRPFAPRNVQETRRVTSQMAVGRSGLFPSFSHHYKALYLRLQRDKWKITKRALKLEVDGTRVFPNVDARYMGIVKEWARLGFVSGYVNGEPREKWFLSPAGQAKFAELGRVDDGPHPPTED